MKNRVRFWNVLRPLSALLLLVATSALWMGCPAGNSTVGQQGSDCTNNDDCVADLECRAKKCRTKIPNTKPTAVLRVDPDTGVKVGNKVLLVGENSRDEEGDTLTYKWSLAGPASTKSKIDDPKAARTSFNPDVAGDYTIGLIVNDGKVDSDLVSIKVKVEDSQNTAPIANAGPDQEVLPGTAVTLDGTSSTDPDGDKLNYAWTLKSKPDGSNASLDKPEFDKPGFTPDLPGDYIVALIVTDVRNATSQEDTVTVRAVKDLDKIPSLTSITPNESVAQSTIDVVVKGKDFVEGAKLLIGPKSIDTTLVSDAELKVKLNLDGITPGENTIKVANPNGKESNTLKFTVKAIPIPEVDKLDPALGPTGAKIIVKVTGKNFIQSSEVFFETTPLKTTYVSETEITAALDLSGTAEGDYKIGVKNPGGISSKTTLTFKVIKPGPPPVLNVLNPPQGTTGQKIPFSVHGSGFEEGATIVFDGKDIPTKRIRRDEMQADPSLDLATIPTGEYDVWVRNIDGQISGKEKFRVEGVDPTPVLDRVLPFIIYIGEKSTLSVFGTSFSQQAKFYINNVEIPINASRSSTTFLEADFDGTTGTWQPGNYKAYVENPKGKKSNDFNVTVTHPTPNIDAVTPSGWQIACDVDVTITGRNFVASSLVNFGSIKFEQNATDPKLKLTRVGSTELKFKVLKTDLSLTTYKVNVYNGPNAQSTDFQFPVLNVTANPGISSIRPGAGPADSQVSVTVSYDSSIGRFLPGSYVEINGKQMPTTCDLSFDGTYCYDITATLDLSGIAPGNLQLYVVNPCGKKSAPSTFVVTNPPTPYLTAISPAFGTVGQKTILKISGRDLAKNHTLYIAGKAVASTWVNDTEITTNAAYDFTGVAADTALDVYIQHANGTKSSTVKYTVLAAQHPVTITKITPDKFEIGKSHSNVDVEGTGFTTNTKLYLDGNLLAASFVSATKLTIGTLNLTNDKGGVRLLQVKENGKDSNVFLLFAEPPPPPVIDYLSPGSKVKGTSTTTYLYIYGSYCPGVSGRCPLNPTVTVIGPDLKDYSSAHTTSYTYDRYIYGNLALSGLPEGDFLFTATNAAGVKSNPGIFKHTPPPPPSITSVNSVFRIAPQRDTQNNPLSNITVSGSNLSSGDKIIVNNDILFPVITNVSGTTALTGAYDFSQFFYGGSFDLYVERCPPTGACVKSNVIKITVLEIPDSANCSVTKNCTVATVSTNEGCTSYKGATTCRPKCTTDAQCKAGSGAPATATCTGGFCK